jgi:hypothetical protein
MKKRRYSWISLLVAVIVVGVGFFLRRGNDNEPRYQGKTVTEWLSSVQLGQQTFSVSEIPLMLDELGSSAVPPLIRILDQDTTPIKDWFSTNAIKMKWAPSFINSLATKHLYNSTMLPFHAHRALSQLGPRVMGAIPDLERIICDPDKERGWTWAAMVLGGMGQSALPAIQRALSNAPPSRTPVLRQMFLPSLKMSLVSVDSRIRESAVLVLSDYPQPPYDVVEWVADMVEVGDAECRKRVLRALGRWIPEIALVTAPAREAIEKAAKSNDVEIQLLANEVLAKLPSSK